MDLNDFAVSVETYEDGFTLMLSDDCGVKLRAAGSDKAQKVRDRLWEPYQSFREIKDDVQNRLNADWIAQGLVVEWIGPWTIGGKPVKTDDPKTISDVLRQKAFKPLRTKLLSAALNDDNFRAAGEAVAAKN